MMFNPDEITSIDQIVQWRLEPGEMYTVWVPGEIEADGHALQLFVDPKWPSSPVCIRLQFMGDDEEWRIITLPIPAPQADDLAAQLTWAAELSRRLNEAKCTQEQR